MPFVGLNQLTVYEHSVLLGPHPCEKKFSLLLNCDLVLLRCADSEFIPLGEFEREHTKVFHHRLAIHADFQIADELIERKIDLMLLVDTDNKTEVHLFLS